MTTAHLTAKRLIASGLIVTSLLSVAPRLNSSVAYAQTAQQGQADNEVSLTAMPPRLGEAGELKAKPGETIQVTIRVRNSSRMPVSVTSTIQDFILAEDGFTPVPVDGEVSNRWSLASWITLSRNVQRLNPNQIGVIDMVVNVPSDALPGGHYAMVLHEPSLEVESINGVAATSSRVSQKVGTLLYFTVEGPINEEAFVRNFELPKLTEFGPVPYKFTVENVSDIHIRPQIGVEIFNVFGKRVDTLSVGTKNIFPYAPRSFEGQWNRVWGIGPYTAKLTMSYGEKGAVVVTQTKFWLIPLKLVLAGIVLVLTSLGALIVVRRHVKHRLDDDKRRIEALEQQLRQAQK